MEGMIIYMLDDVEYPFQKTTLKKMLDHKCESSENVENLCPMDPLQQHVKHAKKVRARTSIEWYMVGRVAETPKLVTTDCSATMSCSRIYIKGFPKFTCPKGCHQELSSNFYVAKCGPAVGLTLDFIASAFSLHRTVKGVYLGDERGCHVIVSYDDETSIQTTLNALDRKPCSHLRGRFLHVLIQFNVRCLRSGRGVLASVQFNMLGTA
ncbi:hypothetical protein Tco_1406733 [Tanacetum coccineum]